MNPKKALAKVTGLPKRAIAPLFAKKENGGGNGVNSLMIDTIEVGGNALLSLADKNMPIVPVIPFAIAPSSAVGAGAIVVGVYAAVAKKKKLGKYARATGKAVLNAKIGQAVWGPNGFVLIAGPDGKVQAVATPAPNANAAKGDTHVSINVGDNAVKQARRTVAEAIAGPDEEEIDEEVIEAEAAE